MELDAYLASKARIDDLARAGDPDTPLPTCPAWRVRDVVAPEPYLRAGVPHPFRWAIADVID